MLVITLVIGLAGSLGLLLHGLRTATDGFKVAAGTALKDNLWRWTADRGRSFLSGLCGAAAVPATAAFSETAFGFTGTGWMRLRNAPWVLIGCSAGAVLTAWLVVGTSFGPLLEVLALTTFALGAALSRARRERRLRPWGTAVLGLGMVLFGVHFLGLSLERWGAASSHMGLDVGLGMRLVLCATAGALLSALLRSTGLAAGIVVLATGAGLLHPLSSLGWMIGIPLGSCYAAVQPLRRGAPDARRLAVAHVVYQGLSAIVGIGIFLCALPIVAQPPGALSDPMLLCGAFLTLLYATSAVAMIALDAPLMRFLFSREMPEEASQDTALTGFDDIPELARQQLVRQVQGMGSITRELARGALGGGKLTQFRVKECVADMARLDLALREGCSRFTATAPPEDVARSLFYLPGAGTAQRGLCEELCTFRTRVPLDDDLGAPLKARMRQVQLAVVHLLESSDPFHRRFSPRDMRAERQGLELQLRELRVRLLKLGTQGTISAERLEQLLDRTASMRRIARLATEAGTSLARALPHPPPGLDDPIAVGSEGSQSALPPVDCDPPAPLPARGRVRRALGQWMRRGAEAVEPAAEADGPAVVAPQIEGVEQSY